LLVDEARRGDMAEKARELVDGRGAERVALALLTESLTLREVRAEDSPMLFAWRDHPLTRAVSSNSAPLVREEHESWLDRVLADPARRLLVGEIRGRPVGVIRFDFDMPDEAEVSLYLDPGLHGCGLGPALLLAGEAAADPALVRATVLEENPASQRLFERCGYSRSGPTSFEKRRAVSLRRAQGGHPHA
jgi:RimJ/RimL family protein N-acetyltransferase